MAEADALLQELGFSEYEARAYIALLQRSPLNGYELAKASGVPRPNIYAVLQKLEERNIVVRMDAPTGVRYAPVPPDELTRRLGHRFKHTLEAATRSLEAVASPVERDYIWNIQGYTAVIEHAQALIDDAQNEVLLAVWQPESQALGEATARAAGRNITINTLCLQACPQDCDDCRGKIYRYQVATNRMSRWLIAIRDGAEMLLGDITPECATAMRTRQAHLIEMASWYIRHSIGLAAVLGDLNGNEQYFLKPETQQILRGLGPDEAGWLNYMLQLGKE
jgi:sugar-specific transcriptional regulator TrmB